MRTLIMNRVPLSSYRYLRIKEGSSYCQFRHPLQTLIRSDFRLREQRLTSRSW